MGLPFARFRVVITTCSLSLAMGPGCFHALPISSSRLITFGARRPSRVGGAFRIKLQCLRFSGLKPLVHHVVTALRCPFESRCFQNQPSVRVPHERAGTSLSFRDLLSGILLNAFTSE